MDCEEETIIEPMAPDLTEAAIFDRQDNFEPVPDGFTAALITLDAKPASSLNWHEEKKAVATLLESNLSVVFELDLALFTKPLGHTGHFQTNVLAINQFLERFLIPHADNTLGVILHRSSIFRFSDEQVDYLELLRSELPDHIPCFLLYDCSEISDPFTFIRLFAPDRFSQFTLALKNASIPLNSLIWQTGKGNLGYIGKALPPPKTTSSPTIGLLLPAFHIQEEAAFKGLKEALTTLINQKTPYKIIAEEFLPLEWEGLDELIINSHSLAPTTQRAIEGFLAAGGSVQEV